MTSTTEVRADLAGWRTWTMMKGEQWQR